jgi:hypothetical protein
MAGRLRRDDANPEQHGDCASDAHVSGAGPCQATDAPPSGAASEASVGASSYSGNAFRYHMALRSALGLPSGASQCLKIASISPRL